MGNKLSEHNLGSWGAFIKCVEWMHNRYTIIIYNNTQIYIILFSSNIQYFIYVLITIYNNTQIYIIIFSYNIQYIGAQCEAFVIRDVNFQLQEGLETYYCFLLTQQNIGCCCSVICSCKSNGCDWKTVAGLRHHHLLQTSLPNIHGHHHHQPHLHPHHLLQTAGYFQASLR